ncbi:MAG: hypothetical protein JW726_14585 [Anaerolineales bacterium]|nr:hypothetical protein [Anaerolineales bacterium]
MNKNLDTYLRRVLKRWAAQQEPPTDVRARLLEKAALVNKRHLARIYIRSDNSAFQLSASPLSMQWPQRDISWSTPFWFGNEAMNYRNLSVDSLQLRVT